jgi:hypothetical protein
MFDWEDILRIYTKLLAWYDRLDHGWSWFSDSQARFFPFRWPFRGCCWKRAPRSDPRHWRYLATASGVIFLFWKTSLSETPWGEVAGHAFSQWPFQEPKLEVPTICKAFVRPM